MLKIILLTLLSVAILTIGGEMIHGLASYLNQYKSHYNILEYIINSFEFIRWGQITSNLFVSGFTILVCMRYFDQLCNKK